MADQRRTCRVDGDHRIKGCPECDLIVEVERLEAERITFHIDGEEVTAEVFNAKFQSMQVEIERLEAERDEALAAIGKKICLMRDPVYECPRCGRRRDTQYGDTCPWCETKRQRAEGMELAASIPKPQYPAHEPDAGYVSGWNEACGDFRQAIRAAAKEQT